MPLSQKIKKIIFILMASLVCGWILMPFLPPIFSRPSLSNRRLAALEAQTLLEMQITNDLEPSELHIRFINHTDEMYLSGSQYLFVRRGNRWRFVPFFGHIGPERIEGYPIDSAWVDLDKYGYTEYILDLTMFPNTLRSGEYVILNQFFIIGRPPSERIYVVGRFIL